jgi:hypothetical protein
MAVEKSSKNKWSTRIDSIEDADVKLREFFKGILIIALIQAAAVVFLTMSNAAMILNIFDPLFMVLFGWPIRKYKSRFLALVFLGYALIIGFATLMAKVGMPVGGFGGKNIFFASALIYIGVIGVRATFFYAAYHKLRVGWKNVILSNLVLAAYMVIFSIALMASYFLMEQNLPPIIKSNAILGMTWLVSCLGLFWLKEMRALPGAIRFQKNIVMDGLQQ